MIIMPGKIIKYTCINSMCVGTWSFLISQSTKETQSKMKPYLCSKEEYIICFCEKKKLNK